MPDMFTQFVGIVLEWYGSLRKSTTGSNSVVFQQTWRLTCQVREIWTMSWTSPHTRNFRKGFALLLLLSLMLSLLYVTFVTRGFNRWERCSREVWTDDSWSKCEPAMFSVVYLFDFLALPFLLLQGFQLSFPFRWCSAMHSLLTKICFWTFLTSSRPCKKGLPSRTTLWTLQWFLWWESCDWENAVKSTSWHSSIPRFAMDDARCWARALFRPFQQGRGRNVSSDHSVDTGTVKLTEVKGSEEMWKTHFWLNFWIAGCCPVRVRRADMFLRTWCPNGESRTALTLNFCFACVTCFPKFLSFSLLQNTFQDEYPHPLLVRSHLFARTIGWCTFGCFPALGWSKGGFMWVLDSRLFWFCVCTGLLSHLGTLSGFWFCLGCRHPPIWSKIFDYGANLNGQSQRRGHSNLSSMDLWTAKMLQLHFMRSHVLNFLIWVLFFNKKHQ